MCNAIYCRVQKPIFNNTKLAIFGDKYLSQDLINVKGKRRIYLTKQVIYDIWLQYTE